jgi:hypothetical protein
MADPPNVHVIDQVLPRPAISAAYNTFKSSQIPMSTLFLDPSDPAARLGDVLPLPLALVLDRYLERIHSEATALGYKPPATFEVWINAKRSRQETFLHVDNDEVLRASTGEVVPPEFGTILYLGPEGEISGGETLIAEGEPSDEVRAEVLFQQLPAERVQATLGANVTAVAPRPGRACIFRGSLAHCVLPFDEPAGGPRVTFLANGWVDPPRSAADGG